MNKKILSQLMILSFAFAGLFLVGNNLMADTPPPETEDQDAEDESGGGTGDWVKCRHHNGSGSFPSVWRDCGTCSTAFFSSSSKGNCYK